MVEAKRRNDAQAQAVMMAHIRNCLRGKGSRSAKANDYLPTKWKIAPRPQQQTMEECGLRMIGTPPPWAAGE